MSSHYSKSLHHFGSHWWHQIDRKWFFILAKFVLRELKSVDVICSHYKEILGTWDASVNTVINANEKLRSNFLLNFDKFIKIYSTWIFSKKLRNKLVNLICVVLLIGHIMTSQHAISCHLPFIVIGMG